ncbi:MAG: ABC transporter substrate-binding protein [Oscillospiraceae bacterium]|nr:ABC transporter substrate-binding protein [Oscillospiraceae bacterium]
MKKKSLIAALSAALALSLCACSPSTPAPAGNGDAANIPETPEVVTVGITQIADHPSLDNCREGFIQGLAEGGFVEGENLEIIYQNAQNDMSIATTIAQSFAAQQVDLMGAIATPSAQACFVAGQDAGIPLIFCAVSDPVAAGLVPAMGQAGNGVTGVSDLIPVVKQLDLIHTLLPEATRLGILYNLSEVNSETQIGEYELNAGNYGIEVTAIGVTAANEIPLAAERLVSQVDCVVNLTDNLIVENLPVLLEKANAAGVPVFGSEEEQVKNGCIASEGLDYVALGRQTGSMAAKVLAGEDISTIGSEYVEDSKLTINKAVAASLGVEIPTELDARAEYTE